MCETYDKIYFEILGRMTAAYDAAPDDANPLTAIQMFARIAADYVRINYFPICEPGTALKELGDKLGPNLPNVTGVYSELAVPGEDDEPVFDPLAQVQAPPIEPCDDNTVEREKQKLIDAERESNQMGGGMTAKPNARSLEQEGIKLSPRESDLLGLMREHPEKTAKDYAEILDTSIGHIYGLQSSMRKKMALLKPKKVTNGE